MPTATFTIGGVERKEGTSKKTGKPYTKFLVHDQDSQLVVETFDSGLVAKAFESVGKRARVEYDVGQWGNDLTSLVIDESSVAHPVANGALPTARSVDGTADWDIIGLRKTRCLLWAHYLGSDAVSVAFQRGETADAVFAFGARLVEYAESDIYWREPALKDAHIPF